jgi:hypothetical protein|tara:strand:+ start:1941 stop:2333 length:393 start_codon:yes stop_codon:yes gene_type:complete
MSIVKRTISNIKASTVPKFSIRLNKDSTVEFRPTTTFAHIDVAQVLKIITKADVDVTNENNNNKVNFKLTATNKLMGFVNYFDNDLDNESEANEISDVVAELQTALSTVKISDITLPMTAGEADDLIDSL